MMYLPSVSSVLHWLLAIVPKLVKNKPFEVAVLLGSFSAFSVFCLRSTERSNELIPNELVRCELIRLHGVDSTVRENGRNAESPDELKMGIRR